LPGASRAGAFAFPVQSEQVVIGTTTGLSGAQTDDGTREVLFESDVASDSVSPPSTQGLTTGMVVGGAFPAGIASDDGAFVQYREAVPPSTDHYPSSQTIATGSTCGGTFPTELQTSNNASLCLGEATATEPHYFRNADHATEVGCTANKVASPAQGAGPVASISLGPGQDACWYADARRGTTIPAGDWESLLDVSLSSYNTRVGAFNIGTGGVGTTVPVVGVGFQPTVVLLWWSGRTTSVDSAGTANHQRGFGVAISTTDRRAVCSQSQDGVDAINVQRAAHRADEAICSLTTGGATDGLADLSSMDPDGFTMMVDDTFATNLRIHYLALGGSTLTNAATGMFTESAATGNQDITTVGFQPDAVILFSAMIGADPPGIAADSAIMVGFAAGPGNPNDLVRAGGSDDGPNVQQTISYHRAGESIALFDSAITLTTARAEVDAWLSNGFSLNWNERAGSRRIHYLALKGGTYLVGDLNTLTVAASTIVESGFGFSPKASLFLSHNKAQSAVDTVQAHDELSLGAFSSATARGAQCVIDEDGVDPSDVGTAVEHDEVYCNLSTGMAIEGLMDVQSVDSDGFTLIMDDPDPVASFVGYMAFGQAITFDVSAQIWNETTDTVTEAVGSCLGVTTPGDDVPCLVAGVPQKVLGPSQVVRIRVAHASSSGTLTIDLDDADATGDSRAILPKLQLEVRHNWSGVPASGSSYNLCVEAYITNPGGQSILVQVLTPPSTWTTRITVTKTSDDDIDQCYLLTGSELNLGAPSLRWVSGLDAVDGTQSYINVDRERIIRIGSDFELDLAYQWTGIAPGASLILSIRGYRSDEDIIVQVLTPPATWNPRLTVNSTTNTLLTYTLTPLEYNGGNPEVRFRDVAASDPSASDMFLDWVSITTVQLTYAAELRQNVTGITSGSNPTLVVKGNISAGGENFHVHVWNFTSAGWSFLSSAPFTPTNAYHNSSLLADHLSGGTVRVRFVDAGSLDSSPWALGLDYVAVVITNVAPALANDGVSPASGHISTSFTFFVRYADPENDAPAFVNLVLDGVPYSMGENNTLDTNYVDGKDFFLPRTIGVRGTFNFFFTTRALAGDPTVTATSGRQVFVLNRAPTISNPLASDGVHTGARYVRDFNASDLDGDAVAWSIVTGAPWLSIGPANGTVWGRAPSTNGSFAVSTSVSDGIGGSAWVNYTLTVGNLRPAIAAIAGAFTSFRRAAFAVDLNASDLDGDALSWSLRTNATFLAINPQTGVVAGVAAGIPSTYWFEVAVSDGFGGVDRRNLTLLVVNRAPQIYGSPAPTAEEGSPYSGQVSATDPDADRLTWSLVTNATWLTLDPASGALAGTPIVGVYYVNVTVVDPYGGVSYQNMTLVVLPPPSLGPFSLTTSWTVLFLGVAAMLIAVLLVVQRRRRPIVEQAFFLDAAGEVRFVFAGPGAPFDEAQVQSLLTRRPGNNGSLVFEPPHFLHIVPRGTGLWVVVSRLRSAARVRGAAKSLFARAEADLATGNTAEAMAESTA